METEDSIVVDGSGTVRLRGAFDLSNAVDLQRCLEAFSTGQRLVLDLSEVTFMDSTALGVLIDTRMREVNITLHRPSPITLKVLRTSGMADYLQSTPEDTILD